MKTMTDLEFHSLAELELGLRNLRTTAWNTGNLEVIDTLDAAIQQVDVVIFRELAQEN